MFYTQKIALLILPFKGQIIRPCYKVAHSPIDKKEARADLKNYRPVSILSALCKFYETFIHKSFAPFVDAFCQLSCQHIKKLNSSNHALLRLIVH